ncbi:hypothetical protein ACLKA6_018195 [Drosophila palustris]
MDKSQLLMFRQPLDAQSQLIIFNSPIDYSDQQLIVYQYPGMLAGDSGYCVVYKRDHYIINNPPNYQSPTKRSFLNECIRQLYIMNGLGHKLHWEQTTSPSNRQEIWKQVNTCLQPERLSVRSASLQRVKRQLFRESRRNRKRAQTQRSQVWGGTKGSHFKPLRHKIERRHIKRSYLESGRQRALQQLIRESLRREMINTPKICQRIINATERIFNVDAEVIERLMERAKRMEALYIQEQMRRVVENQQVILEESVRSMLYAKQLFSLIEKQEEQNDEDHGFC